MHIKKPTLSQLGIIILFAGVAGLMSANAVILYKSKAKIAAEQKAAEDAAKPAELELIILTAPECADCYNVSDLTAPLKANEKVAIVKEEEIVYTSDAGVALIAQYGIPRVPTVIVKGDVDKVFDNESFIQSMGKKAEDGSLVVTTTPAPYLDVPSGALRGTFTLTILTDKSCRDCYDPALHRRALEQFRMKPTKEETADRRDRKGTDLIAAYKIESVPTILLTGDLGAYPNFGQVWPSVGTVEKDGTHVFRAGQTLMGPYYDLKARKLVRPPSPEADAAPATNE